MPACFNLNSGGFTGEGGVLPAILLSSTIEWNGNGFDGLDELAVDEINETLLTTLRTVLGEVEMEKLQKHLDAQASEAVAQAADRMLKNKTARGIVAARMAANPKALAQATDEMLKSKTARGIVAARMAANPQALAQATDEMLKNKNSRRILGKRLMENPEALEMLAADMSEEDWERMLRARGAAKAKGRQEEAPDTP